MNDLFAFADDQGINIFYGDIPACGSLSIQGNICIDIGLCGHDAEERTHLGHELGHCVQGAFYNQYAAADLRARHEHRAEKWAIKKLVPQDELMAAVEDGRTEIWELAEIFGVTEDFMRKAVCWYQTGTLAG